MDLETAARVQGLGLELLALLTCGVAVITDYRSRRVPNVLTGSSALLGGLLLGGCAPWGYWFPLISGPGGALIALLVAQPLTLRGLLGGGDSKLLALVGLCLGCPTVLHVLVCTMLVGGPLALMQGLSAGQLGAALRNLLRGELWEGPSVLQGAHAQQPVRLHRIPYALAIALGTLWTVLVRHGLLPGVF